ncbi:response regulator [Candidatus Sumerlaeota bacterium]|nr:response regulator [Candidatus Sumerlaeota bacterium]
MKRETVVVIEDETDIREVIEHNLNREGYKVLSSSDGEKGLRLVQKKSPDIVLLDLMLPGLDGLDVCRKIKSEPATCAIPVIMVTAKGEESDIVLGLGLGADDYVTKPFSPKELIARVKAVLRRGPLKEEQSKQERLVRGKLVIDPGRHEVRIGDESLSFTATELRLIHFLASYPGRVFTRDHLLRRVIGEDVFVVDRNIDVHIRSVRKKLGEHRDIIETIRGVGYRFQDEEEQD